MTPQVVTRLDAKAAGLLTFFTGRPCKRGHAVERWVSNSDCLTCRLDYRAARYAKESVSAKASALEWYHANIERGRATRRAYGAANAEANKLRCSAWHAENKDRHFNYCKTWVANNRDKVAAYNAKWAAANLDKRRSYVRNRRARLHNAEGSHTGDEIIALLKSQRHRCAGCKSSIKRGYHADHIHPVSRGGSNAISNIQLLCRPCNLTKSDKDPVVWARQIGRLL